MRADYKIDQINNVLQVFIGSISVLLRYELYLVLTELLVYSFHRLYLSADKVIGYRGQGRWLFTLIFLLGKRRVTPTRLAETGNTLISSLEGIIAQLQILTGLFILDFEPCNYIHVKIVNIVLLLQTDCAETDRFWYPRLVTIAQGRETKKSYRTYILVLNGLATFS